MSVAQVAVRLGVEGKAEVKADFAETQAAGTEAFKGIAAAATQAAAQTAAAFEQAAEQTTTSADRAAERQMARWKQQATAAKLAAISGANQDAFNAALGAAGSQQFATVNFDRTSGEARGAADAFKAMFEEEDRAAAAADRLRALIDPLYISQKRYDDELKTWRTALAAGEVTQQEFDVAVGKSETALARARRGLE